MRKASYIIALSLILVFLTGHYFVYKSVLNSHKKEFKTYIRSHFTQTEELEINPSELYTNTKELLWLDDNKELCLNGTMYDIVSVRNAGTKVVLTVVNDADEKALMHRYIHQFNAYQNGEAGKSNTHLLKDFLSLKYFQNAFSSLLLFARNHDLFHNYTSVTLCGFTRVEILPPIG